MSLFDKFSELTVPDTENLKLFNALTLVDFPFSKIGINKEGFPVILILSKIDQTYLSQKNVRLKYLELSHNLECKVSENGESKFDNFSVIIFKSVQKNLQNYFLGIAKTLLQSLSKNPTQKEVFETFRHFVEIFRSLSDSPLRTLQGLWAELLIIERAKDPECLLNYWHNIPEEKFDFNADLEKIEVKSNSSLDRIHIFSAEQLDPPNDKQVLIASIFMRQSSKGKSLNDLLSSIQSKITDATLVEKLFYIISKTLGNSVEQSLNIKYDYDLALNSLRYYRHQDISKIEKLSIPLRVSEVKYKSDLSDIKPFDKNDIDNDGILFKAI